MLQELEPMLPVHNVEATVRFWRDALGFDVTGQSSDWARVSKDRVSLMFSTGTPPKDFDGLFVIRADDVDAVASQVSADAHWGPRDTADHRREVAYRDPNAYVINFTQNTGPERKSH